jgi:flagellar hook-associated protein 1 FlgK
MSISQALRTAQSIFSTTGTQMATASKNVSNATNSDYNRRLGVITTTEYGAHIIRIDRSQDGSLLRLNNEAISSSEAQSTLLAKLNDIQTVLGGNDQEDAPSTKLADLRKALQTAASKPNDNNMAQNIVDTANSVARSLNAASTKLQEVRTSVDKEITQTVADLKGYLEGFQAANDTVRGGTATDKEVNDALDQRDSLLKKISEIVGIHTVTRANNDMAVYTTDGTVLFETLPRNISFTANSSYDATTVGNSIYIDGVPVSTAKGGDTNAIGKLQALMQVRDTVAPMFQSQLDETARGLVTLFAEKDQTASGAPDKPGLFTWTSGTVPSGATTVAGLASSIKVNPAVDPSKGGNLKLIRDGGINGAAYIGNTAGNSGYATILQTLVDNMDLPINFDAAAGIDTKATVLNYATSSLGWFEQLRKDATAADERKQALLSRTTEALTNKVGVSIDEEMSLLMDLEQSYKASTKIVSTVDAMMQALLGMVR